MSASCEILVTEWDGGQAVVGEIILKDEELSFSAKHGYELFMENVMQGKTFVGEKVCDPTTDPEAWLRSLPSCYTGSIVRARLGENPVESEVRGVADHENHFLICRQRLCLDSGSDSGEPFCGSGAPTWGCTSA